MITMLLTIAVSASALSYSRARTQALFLTDKMAYELNLTDDQYNACYEINLDYYLSISVEGDLFGVYWTRRNQDLSYVLSPSQYAFYTAATYFYRPVTWVSRAFHYVIYDRYNKNRFYRKAPSVYGTYRGGNRMYSSSPYKGRVFTTKNEPRKNVGGSETATAANTEVLAQQLQLPAKVSFTGSERRKPSGTAGYEADAPETG